MCPSRALTQILLQWLTVETTKQFLYPMVLTATVLQMLYKPGDLIRPAIWLGTMFGVATIKSLYGVIAEGDLYYLLFGAYGFMVRLLFSDH